MLLTLCVIVNAFKTIFVLGTLCYKCVTHLSACAWFLITDLFVTVIKRNSLNGVR